MNPKSAGTIDHDLDLIPLSRAQYGMWLADNLPGRPAANIAHYIEIDGPLDVDVFTQAVINFGEETEALVVRVVEFEGRPYQFVDRSIGYSRSVLDLTGEDDPFAAAMEWMRRDYQTKARDLSRDRLAATQLFRIGEHRHLWYARAHHLVVDGYGAFNGVLRIAEHYNAIVESRPAVPWAGADLRAVAEAELAYRSGPRYEADRAYWLGKVADLPAPVGLSGRTARWSPVDVVAGRQLPPRLAERIDALAAELHASPAQVVIAVFAAFLARMTGSDDVVLSMPVSGRVTRRLREALAMLANMVPIRFPLDPTATVAELVRTSATELVSAIRHQLYRFEDLRRDSGALDADANSFGPVVNVLFFDSEIRLGAAVGHYRALTSGPLDDLQLNLYRSGPDAPLLLEMHGNAHLYEQHELDSHADRFLDFLARVTDSPVDTPVAEIPLLDPAERRRIVGELAGRDGAVTTATLVDLLAERAASDPAAVAVTAGTATLTYRELEARSNRLARALIARGAGPETLVAIALPRDANLIVAAVAVLKSGAGYLPLDTTHPAERLEYVCADADPVLVLTDHDGRDRLPGDSARTVLFDDLAAEPTPAGPITDAERLAPLRGGNIAYVIYTSGSTGRPKGVAIAHRAVATYLLNSCAAAGVGPGDVWTLFHSFAFDYSVWEIFGALTSGGRVVVVDGATTRSPDEVVRLVARERITVFNQTPSAFQQFIAARERYARAGEPEGGLALRLVILSGERLDPAGLESWYRRHSDDRPVLVNSYGITETTVFVTYLGLTAAGAVPGAPSAMGPALPGLRTYLLDDRLRPVPLGAWGEIYVSGAQLARGYLARPGLSASRFVADPFGAPGDRLYRSGDIARRDHRGGLEYRGRADLQVQLRGFRIELDEVRNALLTHPTVAAAAVVVHNPDAEAATLVAYVVPAPETGCAADVLRAHVAAGLPEYMVPAAVVVLDALPLTVNGKVDHRALPDPVFDSAAVYRAPAPGLEETIADVFAEVLGIEQVGALDGFFELGGNSLTATGAAVRIAETAGCEVSVRDLFGTPTVAGLAARLGAAGRPARPPLRARPRSQPIAPAPAQNRMWLINQADPDSAAYNIPLVVRLTGRLDHAALRAALTDVIDRHETLRTVYPAVDGMGTQVVVPAAEVVGGFELTPAPADDIAGRIGELTATGPDVSARPPIHAALLAAGRRSHVLVLVLHHICCDGASLRPLAADVAQAYEARAHGKAPDWSPLTVQYADYSAWHRELLGDEDAPDSVAARQLDYWIRRLAGKPALLELPADHARPVHRSMRGGRTETVVAAETFAGVRSLAREAGVTTFMVVHGALAVLLARLSGTTDITVGTPVAGRGERALEPLVGMFVNTVPLRTEVRPDETFTEFLARVKDADVDAFANSDLPYERVVEAIAPRDSADFAPLCQVYLAFENMDRPSLELSDLTVEVMDAGPQPAKVDLIVTVAENAAGDGADERGVAVRFDYATDLFEQATVEEFGARFVRVLEAIVTHPGHRVGRLEVLSAGERAATAPAVGAPAEPARVLAEVLAVRDPGAVAVICGDRTLSYAGLDAWSNRVARRLIALGAGPGDHIGLAAARSVEFVVGIWAVARAGAAFVPVDPRNPAERIALLIADAGIHVALAVTATRDMLPGSVTAVMLDESEPAAAAAEPAPPVTDADRIRPCRTADTAYVLYTSGSTGIPKGVAVTHEGLANFAAEQRDRYRVDARARVLQLAAPGFDAVMLEVLMAHANGAALVVCPPEVYAGPELAELIGAHRVSHAFITPSVLATMSPEGLGTLRVLVAGGEAVPPETVAVWAPGRELFNGYGPTETTIMVAISDPLTAGERVTLGGPLRGVEAMILDSNLQPVPVGVTGQLYISGVQLARGYLGRPAATAAAFVAGARGRPGARMYRTGDLARWTADGTIEYAGRTDFQVKIRGQRIELGEIDAVLAAHPAVKVAVTVGVGTGGDTRLATYVVPHTTVDTAELLGYAAQRLPSHMVPGAVVVLVALPLSPVGKIDRAALPEPEFGATTTEFVPARDAAEATVAGVYAEVLGLDRVGAFDSFFELGGNSLSATRVVSRLGAVTGVGLALRTLFDAPTPAALAESIRKGTATGRVPLGPRPRTGRIPLSPAQARMWFLNQMDTTSPLYNIAVVLRLGGALDVAAMHATLADVLDRHETLRTRYPDSDTGPHQVIAAAPEAIAAPEPEDIAAERAEARLAAEVSAGFDVTREIPVRITLLRTAADTHILVLVVHHIAFDGSSLAPLAADLMAAYRARVRGTAPEWSPLPVQYADYTMWQRELLGAEDDPHSPAAAQTGYWRAALADLPEVLDLPTDRPRPAAQSFRGATISATLPADIHRAVIALAAEHDMTVFMVLHAAYAALLARLSGSDDIAVGTPIAGRGEPGLDGLVGMFVNTLVLRTRVGSGSSFLAILDRVRTADLGAFENADIPFERLVEVLNPRRSTAHAPLTQVGFSFQNIEIPTVEFEGLAVEARMADPSVAKYDLHLQLVDDLRPAGEPGGLGVEFGYATDLFDESTVAAIFDRYLLLLRAVLADPRAAVGDIDLLTAQERQRSHALATGAVAAGADTTVAALFAEQAARTPGNIALIDADSGTRIDYATFAGRVNALARTLIGRGIGPGAVVGIAMRRGTDLLTALYAVHAAGAAYLPLDPEQPAARTDAVLATARPAAVLTRPGDGAELPAGTVVWPFADLAAEPASPDPVTDADRIRPLVPADLAYVIYTSGSTGEPKGVAVPHRAVANQLRWMRGHYDLGGGDVMLLRTPVTFDLSVWELFSAPTCGASLVVAGPDAHRDPAQVARLLAEYGVTTVDFVPSLLAAFLEPAARYTYPTLRRVLCIGEALPAETVRRFRDLTDARIDNLYGPTEAAVSVTAHRVGVLDGPIVAIGVPEAGVTVRVLDSRLRPVVPGVIGELYLGGVQLARGYLERRALTCAAFVADPFGAPGERLYRTGDLVRRDASGDLRYIGRSDTQVKLRGLRIEPGEIEAALRAHDSVVAAVAQVRTDHGEQSLIAHVVAGSPVDGAELRAFLQGRLPGYMVPSSVQTVDAIPLTANGKVDYRALPAPRPRPAESRAPRGLVEQTVAGVFAELLGVPDIGAEADFFDLGGNSLLATRALSRVGEILEVTIPVPVIFEAATVADLAERITRLRSESGVPAPVARPRPDRIPLSPAQTRMWFLDQFEPDSAAYVVPLALRLDGELDLDALTAAVTDLVERHESLRTVYPAVDGVPSQVVLAAGEVLAHWDLTPEPLGERDLARRLADISATGFDVTKAVPVRAAVYQLADTAWVIALAAHHISCDGYSMGPLAADLVTAYRARAAGLPPDWAPLPLQFADYALWQREVLGSPEDSGSRAARDIAYWRQQLAGLPEVLELPADRPRPVERTQRGAVVHVSIPAELQARVEIAARRAGATPFMVVHTALAVLLSALSGSDDIAIGVPHAGRGHRSLDTLIGMFVNTLVLRTRVTAGQTVGSVLDQVRRADIEAFDHATVPFEQLVEVLRPARSTAHTPLFQVLLAYQNMARGRVELPGLTVENIDPGDSAAIYDMLITVAEEHGPRHEPAGMSLRLTYATDLYDEQTVRRFTDRFIRVLDAVAGDTGTRVGEIDLLDAAERRLILETWNDTEGPAATGHTLVDAFDAQVARTPEVPALCGPDGTVLTYGEFDARINRVARVLIGRGAGPETVVGVAVARSIDQVTALYAVLKAGAAFLPIDPEYPAARIAAVLTAARPLLVLTGPGAGPELPAGYETVRMDRLDTNTLSGAPVTDAERRAPLRSADIAYILFTSGSTGTPKGVALTHAATNGQLAWAQRQWPHDESDAVLYKTPVTFDIAVWELFWPLRTGARIVIAEPGGHRDPRYLATVIAEHGITTTHFVPSMLDVLLELTETPLPSVRRVFAAGEALAQGTVDNAAGVFTGAELVNWYGPAEAEVVTSRRCRTGPSARAAVPIGAPVSDMRVYVLDSRLRPVPRGITGELYVSGTQLARGYYGSPGRTGVAFVAHPYGRPGERLYRTGDLVRWSADGELEYRGRADFQVKVRGQRVEPGDIEAALYAQPEVVRAVVLATPDRITGYVTVVPDSGADGRILRDRVARSLPSYLVPGSVQILDAIPLTANGKVDRSALPSPVADDAVAEYVAPRDDREETLARVVAEIAGATRVSVTANLFEAGVNSLSAGQIAARGGAALGIDIGIRDIFDEPTIAGLAARLAVRAPSGAAPLEPRPRPEVIPPAAAQRRMWFLNQFDTASAAYNIGFAAALTGPLDLAALRAAFRDVLDRHEPLRTMYPPVDGEPCQVIRPTDEVCDGLVPDPEPMPGDADPAERIRQATGAGFDVARAVPLRTRLFRSGPEEHVLVLVAHHIAADGASMAALARDVFTAYEARARGHAPGWAPLPVQYADYALWQRDLLGAEDDPDSLVARQIDYWTATLGDAPELLELPTDRPRPAVVSTAGAAVRFDIPARLHDEILRLSRREGVTLFVVLHTALAVLLARTAQTGDICIGTPVAGRGQRALDDLVGMFVNTVVLRTPVRATRSFRELLAEVRETDVEALAHAELPYERLVDLLERPRSTAYTPLFQVMFGLQDMGGARFELPGLGVELLDPGLAQAKTDLTVVLGERFDHDRPAGISGEIVYATDLFRAATAESFADRFVRILEAVAGDPAVAVGDIDLLGGAETRALVPAGGGPAERPRLLPALLADAVSAYPAAIAVVGESGTLTYAELGRRSDALAAHLAARGAGPGVFAALAMPRSIGYQIAMWAIAKTGATFVPVDLRYPPERITHMIRDAGVVLGVTVAEARPTLPDDVRWSVLDDPRTAAAVETDADRGIAAPEPGTRIGDAAYVIYTSGSTGTPKGVVVTHAGLASFAAAQRDRYGVDASARVLHVAAPAFDAVLLEALMACAAGAALVVSPPDVYAGAELARLMRAHEVTHAFLTPSVLATLSPAEIRSVRVLAIGGERMPPELVATWAPDRQLHNIYGPTETTIVITMSEPVRPGDDIDIGGPIRGARAVVLDARLRPVPPGVPGELYLSGDALARGYLNRPGPTAAAFVADPYGEPGSRMYRTGDIVRWTGRRTLEYIGRVDFQVKIRGQRIELGEIDAALVALAEVAAAVTVARPGPGGQPLLAAYLVADGGGVVDVDAVPGRLAGVLPAHMIPAAITVLDRMPLSSTGKVDRKALPDPVFDTAAGDIVAPAGALETTIAAAFADVLGVDVVGATTSFFALGGDSIMSIQLASRLKSAGVLVRARDIFERKTVRELARVAESAGRVALDELPGGGVGAIAPTPIVSWFIERLGGARRFAQSTLVRLPADARAEEVAATVRALLDRHDMLRSRLRDGQLEVLPAGAVDARDAVLVQRFGADRAPGTEGFAAVAEAAAYAATELLDPSRGRMLQVVCLLPEPGVDAEGRALVVIHHLAVDGVSWRILLPDFATAWQQLRDGRAVELPVPGTSMRRWAHALPDAAARRGGELELWHRMGTAEDPPLGTAALDPAVDTQATVRYIPVSLPPEVTTALLDEVPAAVRGSTDDALLAALAMAVTRWRRRRGGTHAGCTVLLEGHGREEQIAAGADLARTVGWFTSAYPVALDLTGIGDADVPAAVKSVKDQLRAIPDKGIGYGLLRYLDPVAGPRLAAAPEPQIGFNYLGRAGVDLAALSGVAWVPTGDRFDRRAAFDPDMPAAAAVTIDAHIEDTPAGPVLAAQIGYATRLLRHDDAAELAGAWTGALTEIAAAARAGADWGLSPSDVSPAGITQADLDAFTGRYGPLTDVWPPAPLQAGLLFHAEFAAGELDVYTAQSVLGLAGTVDAHRLERAAAALLGRHPNLRAAFTRTAAGTAVQVIPVASALRWHTVESCRDAAELDALIEAERSAVFDPADPPLLRFLLAEVEPGDHRLVLTAHHLLLDGWSLPLLCRELIALYAVGADPALLPPAPAYRDYLDWLATRDDEAGLEVWRDALREVTEPTLVTDPVTTAVADLPADLPLVLDPEATAALADFARDHAVTVATIVQFAWAVVLGNLTGAERVTFGATVSGRPAELPGVESMIGLFINTIPVAVDLTRDHTVAAALNRLQAGNTRLLDHHHLELSRVLGAAGMPNLFDTLVVFESYPVDSSGLGATEIDGMRVVTAEGRDAAHYPLMVQAHQTDRLHLRLRYQRARIGDATAAALAARLEAVLRVVISAPGTTLGALDLLTPAEREALVPASGGAVVERSRTLAELLAAGTALDPGATALVSGDRTISYAELDEWSTRLARHLIGLGVRTGDHVALVLPRSPEFVAGLWAVTKAGAGFVAVDTRNPADRIAVMAADAGVRVALTTTARRELVPDRVHPVVLDDPATRAEIAAVAADPIGASDRVRATHLLDTAYVIYTSGSTGVPKGVALTHEGLANFAAEQRDR
ncbi:non-ribosomal peptide synthase/polyketide synthase, partial [Nocardia sp. NPDC003345]